MCFRPTSAAKAVECPHCQKKLPIVGGVKQKKCPFCGTAIPQDVPDTATSQRVQDKQDSVS